MHPGFYLLKAVTHLICLASLLNSSSGGLRESRMMLRCLKSLIPEKSDQISISKNIMTGMTIRWF